MVRTFAWILSILVAVAIPTATIFFTMRTSKEKRDRAYVRLAVEILSAPDEEREATAASKQADLTDDTGIALRTALRFWATEILQSKSETPLSEEAIMELKAGARLRASYSDYGFYDFDSHPTSEIPSIPKAQLNPPIR